MKKLSNIEEMVYIGIYSFIKKHHYSPSVRDLCQMLDRSPATIHKHLKDLKKKEFIDYKEKQSRTIIIKER